MAISIMPPSREDRLSAFNARQDVVDALTDLLTDPSKPVAQHLYHFGIVSYGLGIDTQVDRILKACTPDIKRVNLLAEARDEITAALMISCAQRLIGREPLKLT